MQKKGGGAKSLKKARGNGMTKRLLIIEGWDIAVDDNYMNSIDSNINDVKKKLNSQMMTVMIIVMIQISVL